MSVTPDDVRHIAQLARLGVAEERVPALVNELNGILGHMQRLQEVVLEENSATEAARATPLRDDAVPSVSLERKRESFAPLMREGFFLVPRLATHETQTGAASVDEEMTA